MSYMQVEEFRHYTKRERDRDRERERERKVEGGREKYARVEKRMDKKNQLLKC